MSDIVRALQAWSETGSFLPKEPFTVETAGGPSGSCESGKQELKRKRGKRDVAVLLPG